MLRRLLLLVVLLVSTLPLLSCYVARGPRGFARLE